MEKKIGVIHYNFRDFSLEQVLDWEVKENCTYIELMAKDIIRENKNPDTVAEKLASKMQNMGLKVSQIAAGNDFCQKTEDDFKKTLKTIETLCRIVKIFGANQLRIDGGWPKEGVSEKNYKNLIETGLKQGLEYAEKEGVFFALDNHGVITNNYQLQLELFESIGSKKLGANLDTMNYRWYGYSVEELPEIYKAIAPYVLHTHMKDGFGNREKYQGQALGEGEIPLLKAIQSLKDAGYQGVWCAEYEGKELENGTGYGKCVRWLENNV